jgi:hypothetical protein
LGAGIAGGHEEVSMAELVNVHVGEVGDPPLRRSQANQGWALQIDGTDLRYYIPD